MKTVDQLRSMEEYELINEVLKLQNLLNENKPEESKASQIHNYHFASERLLKCGVDQMLGSAVIFSVHDLRGNLLIKPVSISDGFSNSTINNILDDLQRTYDWRIELKPTTKRLKVD